jgi:hypothetical protein
VKEDIHGGIDPAEFLELHRRILDRRVLEDSEGEVREVRGDQTLMLSVRIER